MLINGEKWACETCIKGHRASHCKHTNRQLIQIKKKGRPSTQCNRCKELRIIRQLHVKCNCSQNSDSSNSDDAKRKDSSNNTTVAPLAPVSTSPLSSCGNTTESITTPTSSCCSNKAQSITTSKTSSCCGSSKTIVPTSKLDNDDGNYYNTNNYSPSPPIQNPTPPQEQEQQDTLPSEEHTSIYHTSNLPSPYIPPPTSCCGPPTKNKNGENIRIVTCRCGDSCACPGCDAHPSRAMKEGTNDVYYGFETVTTDMLGRRRISISRICSSEEEDVPESTLCGCGCAQLFENCAGCFNDLCQCNFL
ncbi:copper-fist-domain-containing protein [Backusella circina FSU 941]|nr:copper-fist-domain-containing protein [Backusella circina FSU 941]